MGREFTNILEYQIKNKIGDPILKKSNILLHYCTTPINPRSHQDFENHPLLKTRNFDASFGDLKDRRWIDVLVPLFSDLHGILMGISTELCYTYQNILLLDKKDLSININRMIWSKTHKQIWQNPDINPGATTRPYDRLPQDFTKNDSQNHNPNLQYLNTKKINGTNLKKYYIDQGMTGDGVIPDIMTKTDQAISEFSAEQSRAFWKTNGDATNIIEKYFEWCWGVQVADKFPKYTTARQFPIENFLEMLLRSDKDNCKLKKSTGAITSLFMEIFVPVIFTKYEDPLPIQKFNMLGEDSDQARTELATIPSLTTNDSILITNELPPSGNETKGTNHHPLECVIPVQLNVLQTPDNKCIKETYASFIKKLKERPVICRFNLAADIGNRSLGLWLHTEQEKMQGYEASAGQYSPRIEAEATLDRYPSLELDKLWDFSILDKDISGESQKTFFPSIAPMVCVGMRYVSTKQEVTLAPDEFGTHTWQVTTSSISLKDEDFLRQEDGIGVGIKPDYVQFLFDTTERWAKGKGLTGDNSAGIPGKFWITINIEDTAVGGKYLQAFVPWSLRGVYGVRVLTPDNHGAYKNYTNNIVLDNSDLDAPIYNRFSKGLDGRWMRGKGRSANRWQNNEIWSGKSNSTNHEPFDTDPNGEKSKSRMRFLMNSIGGCAVLNDKDKDAWKEPQTPTVTSTGSFPTPSATPTPAGPCANKNTATIVFNFLDPENSETTAYYQSTEFYQFFSSAQNLTIECAGNTCTSETNGLQSLGIANVAGNLYEIKASLTSSNTDHALYLLAFDSGGNIYTDMTIYAQGSDHCSTVTAHSPTGLNAYPFAYSVTISYS